MRAHSPTPTLPPAVITETYPIHGRAGKDTPHYESTLRRTPGQFGASTPNCLAYEAGAEALSLWEEIWPGPAMKLVGRLAAGSPGLRLGLRLDFAFEIERHCGADEILQGRFIDFVALVDVDGAPDIPLEAGVE